MFLKYSLLFFYILSVYQVSTITYDQRQTGEFNVQIDVKDVQIIALMKNTKEEYVDYDYAYDYSEMTIKPQNRTTPKPFNATSATINRTSAGLDSVVDKTTIATTVLSEVTTAAPNKTYSDTSNTTVLENTTTLQNTVDTANVTEIPIKTEDKNITTSTESTNSTNCKKGFVLNRKGECELKLQGTGNALLKLVKLSQKLKLRRENRSNTDD